MSECITSPATPITYFNNVNRIGQKRSTYPSTIDKNAENMYEFSMILIISSINKKRKKTNRIEEALEEREITTSIHLIMQQLKLMNFNNKY